MPPRLNIFQAPRQFVIRPRPIISRNPGQQAICRRFASDQSKDLPQAKEAEAAGPNMNQQEHVSEEAAKMAKITGGEGPDLSVGTPVQDILKEDAEARKDAPQVIKDSIKNKQTPPKPQSRPFSTYARRRLEMDAHPPASMDPPVFDLQSLEVDAEESAELVEDPGHKFGLPTLPLASNMHKDYRYDPVVKQVTNLMMQDGKLSVAQRNMAFILQHLRTASPPSYNPSRPLLPGAPPASHLPLNPILYLTLALDSIAPLMRIRSQRGAAGGGVALQIPVPLGLRQRRRQAFVWVLDAASKRKARGSGRGQLAQRIAEELVAVVEGRSSIWDKRTGVHKLATTARSNLKFGRNGRRM